MAWTIRRAVVGVAAAVAVVAGAMALATMADEPKPKPKRESAIFAAGCFWCVEQAFEKHEGVIDAVSGYIGGHVENPTYKQVTTGTTGHHEAVRVVYDPSVITYRELVDIFWHNADPIDGGGQFCDRGSSYLSGIFYLDAQQERVARESVAKLEKSGRFSKPIATKISKADTFYPAEDYHQDFYKKNPQRYWSYKKGCGREARLKEIWG